MIKSNENVLSVHPLIIEPVLNYRQLADELTQHCGIRVWISGHKKMHHKAITQF